VTVTAGGRADLGITMPSDGKSVRVQVSKGTAVILGAEAPPAPPQPPTALDLLGYGSPTALSFDPAKPDRRFEYRSAADRVLSAACRGCGGRSTATSIRMCRCTWFGR
jgi:hypothetical protein